MNPATATSTSAATKRSLTKLHRANLVGNYGPSPDIKFETATMTIEEVDSPGPETYQLARARKAPPAPRTTYGGKVGRYDSGGEANGNGSRKQLVVGANLEDIIFEEADEEITYEEPYYDEDPDADDGTGDMNMMEAYEDSSSEVKPDYNNILSSPGSSCSGTSSSKRKSIDEMGGMTSTGRPMSKSQQAAMMRAEAARTKKMYELDPVIYPHAAAARASYENRIRKKREKEQMIADLAFYKAGYERLSLENEQLKEEIHEMRHNTSATEWFKFFRNAGIVQGNDIEYANLFEEQRMKPSMLGDFDENLLRSIGITAFGDIHQIVKHAKNVFEHTQGRSLFIRQSVQRPPKITSVRSLKSD